MTMPNCNTDEPTGITVLVHGTRSSDLAWQPTLALIRQRLGDQSDAMSRIRTFEWSGDNSHSGRLEAADKLKRWLLQNTENNGQQVTLVGHSHGGNVCIYAAADPSVSPRILKIVTLGTPFISVRRRRIDEMFTTLLTSVALWTLPPLFAFAIFCVGQLNYSTGSVWPSIIASIIVLTVGLLIPFLALYWGVTRSDACLTTLLCRQNDEYDRLALPSHTIPVICFRVARDEAGFILTFARLISELPAKIFETIFFIRKELLDSGERFYQKGIRYLAISDRVVHGMTAAIIGVPLFVLFCLLVVWPRFLRGFGERSFKTHLLLDVKASPLPPPVFSSSYAFIPAGNSTLRRALLRSWIGLRGKSEKYSAISRPDPLLRHSAFFTSIPVVNFLMPPNLTMQSVDFIQNQNRKAKNWSELLGRAFGKLLFFAFLLLPVWGIVGIVIIVLMP